MTEVPVQWLQLINTVSRLIILCALIGIPAGLVAIFVDDRHGKVGTISFLIMTICFVIGILLILYRGVIYVGWGY